MAKFIAKIKHPTLGEMEVFEDARGVNLYGKSEQAGNITFQGKKPQAGIRGLMISLGYGGLLKKKPTALEVANHAPEFPAVSVADNAPETPEAVADVETAAVSVSEPESKPKEPVKKRKWFDIGI